MIEPVYWVRVYFMGRQANRFGPLTLDEARAKRVRLRKHLAAPNYVVKVMRDRSAYWAARDKLRKSPQRRAQVRKAQRAARARARGETHG
jgi:hypothetical protein